MIHAFFFILFLASAPLWGADHLVPSIGRPLPLGKHLRWVELQPQDPDYLQETPGIWLNSQVRKQGTSEILNFSFSPNHYWFELELHNSSAVPQNYLLEIATAWLDQIYFFEDMDHPEIMQKAGDLIPHADWSNPYRYPVFSLQLAPGEQKTFWIRLQSQDNLVIPFLLWDVPSYQNWERHRNLFFGLYYGLLISICILNGAMFLFSKRRSFLKYTLYIASYSLLQFTLDGFLAEVSGHFPTWLLNRLYGTLNFFTIGFAGLFAIDFLSIRRYAPRLARFINVSCQIFLGFGMLCLLLPSYGLGIRAALVAMLGYSPMILICSWYALQSRTRAAWYFMMAWGPLILGIVILGLTAFDLIPSNIYSRSLIYFGIALEFIILSIGLGDKLHRSIQEHAMLRNNLEAAEAVQKALIPAMPEVEGLAIHSWYQAAESTGGDWYEVIPDRRNNRLYCFIGDVTGHGISSTLVTSAVASAVHSLLHEKIKTDRTLDGTLDDLLDCLNRTVYRTGFSSGRLLTMNLIGIDLKTRECLLINAGHPHPLIFRQEKVLPLTSLGSMLGLREKIRISKKTFTLAKGDILFLYTDGLIHKHSEDDVELKLHRLIRLVSKSSTAEELVQTVKNKYLEIYGAHALEDDCSVLALQVIDEPEKTILVS